MKALKIILYACLFFLIGEILVRIDRKFDLLNNAPQKIAVEIEESDLLKSVQEGGFISNSSQFRILVIGDSYIHGGGINSSEKFSKQLSTLLNAPGSPLCNYVVLDVSVPRNNTLDNYNSFDYFYKNFDPQLVFWAYNYNDILGKLKKDVASLTNEQETTGPPKQTNKKRTGISGIIKTVYAYSRLALYLSEGAQKELKTAGIITPGGDFHNLTKKAYLPTSKKWLESQQILTEVAQVCQSDKTDLILYKMPEFNLMHKPALFSLPDNALLNYADSMGNMTYIDGSDEFEELDPDELRISKYDGHPNAKAHKFIADRIAEFISNMSTRRCSGR